MSKCTQYMISDEAGYSDEGGAPSNHERSLTPCAGSAEKLWVDSDLGITSKHVCFLWILPAVGNLSTVRFM